MRFGSVCSGVEAASLAFNPLGMQAAWFSEIEPFPCALLAERFPDVPNLGDMTTLPARILEGDVEAPDVFCGGTPCFTGGHLVLTDKGYLPIKDVRSGMMVMTHQGRLRKVLRVGSKVAKTGKLFAVGHREVECTKEHPFLSVFAKTWQTGSRNTVSLIGAPEWVEAEKMSGRYWCALQSYSGEAVEFDSAKFSTTPGLMMRFAGMYVGDGWIRRFSGCNKKSVVFGFSEKKLSLFKSVFGDIGYIHRERTVFKVVVSDTKLAEWLIRNFGEHADGKRIPTWVLSSPWRREFLQGYLDTDGFKRENGLVFSTISSALAFGIADLCNAEGYAASVKLIKVAPTKIIEGRTVNQRDWYQVRAFSREASRKSRTLYGFLCRRTSKFEDLEAEKQVFNLEVEEDNSYILEGMVVHNCQAFSVAGLRRSLDDYRGNLSLVFCEIANAIDTVRTQLRKRPVTIFWENVPGVLNTKDNAFGCFLGGLAGADAPLSSGAGRWPSAGYVAGPSRNVAWRVLDAQYFGVPQRRRRVYVVASSATGGGIDPTKILFESQGVRRDSASCPNSEQSSAAFAESSFGAFRECGPAGTLKASGGVLGGGSETLKTEIVK